MSSDNEEQRLAKVNYLDEISLKSIGILRRIFFRNQRLKGEKSQLVLGAILLTTVCYYIFYIIWATYDNFVLNIIMVLSGIVIILFLTILVNQANINAYYKVV